jgi:hypothetical protein
MVAIDSVGDAVTEVTEPDRLAAVVEVDLIQLLEAIAAAEGLSGAALARSIGINQALWSRVRRGLERFGPGSCAKVALRYPRLREACARYLAGTYQTPELRLLGEADRVIRSAPFERAG